jgi:hypothetical protein
MELARDLFDTTHPLPDVFARWFASRGWQPRAHQLDLLAKARAGRSALVNRPAAARRSQASADARQLSERDCGRAT